MIDIQHSAAPTHTAAPGMPAYLDLLDPEAIAKISRIEMLARGQVAGFISGRHRSPYHGFSVEFAEHREYSPGDDLRDLDWRVLGRSDRYYIKRYIEETNLRATILLDASGSMSYRGDRASHLRGQTLSKFEYARFLAASMARLLLNQQDAVGLVTFDKTIRRYLPARSRSDHLRLLLGELHATQPGDESALAPVFDDIAERIPRRGLVIVISDLFDDATALVRAFHHFRHRKHDLILMHVMADEELVFPFDRWSQFKDLERAGAQVEADPVALRAAYLQAVREHVAALTKCCGELHADYVPFCTRQEFDVELAAYLAHRRSLIK